MHPVVYLCNYQSEWKESFEVEKLKIMQLFSNQKIQIEHIGSTSIKGLRSKPIIDILLGIEDLNIFERFIDSLTAIQYEYVPQSSFHDRKFFKKEDSEQFTCHLHICTYNGQQWKEKLLFRDYIKAHPSKRKEYEKLKEELAITYQFNRSAYTKGKEDFIRSVIHIVKLRESAVALRETKNMNELLHLQKQHPTNPEVLYQCAWLHDNLGLEREAIPLYKAALECGLEGEEKRGALLGLGSTYRTIGEYELAKQTLKEGIEHFQNAQEFYIFYAMTLYNLGEVEEAMEILLQKITELTKNDDIHRYKKAILFYSDKLNETW